MIQTVEVRRAGVVMDACQVVLPLSITHGRSDVTNQPDPPAATVTWDGEVCPWQVGDNLEIWSGTQYEAAVYDDDTQTYDDPQAAYDGTASGEFMMRRFVGVVAGLTANGALGVVASWTVEAIGGLARLGTRPIKITRPQERDTARVAAIAAAAGVTVKVVGAQGVVLAAGDIDSDALAALHAVCESTGGLVWQTTDGTITYGTAKHRPGEGEPLGLIPCEALDSVLSWDEDMETIVNEVTVHWGPSTAPLEATHRDSDSAAMPWGVRHTDINTLCASEIDADELALLVIARRAWPYYGVTNGLISVPDLTPDHSRLFHSLDVSSPVLIPIPSLPGPTPTDPTPVVVEGWVETWDAGGLHTAQAAFSDQRRWVLTTLRTWSQLRDEGTYAHWKTTDWLHALVKEG